MATHRVNMLNFSATPTGACYFIPLSVPLSDMGNLKDDKVLVMPDPNTAGDHGVHGNFDVPENYSGSELVRAKYYLDGAPSTLLVGLGVRFLTRGNDDNLDAVYGSEIVVSENPSEADEDLVIETISVTAHTFVAGAVQHFDFFVDDSVATPYTGQILVAQLHWEYSD